MLSSACFVCLRTGADKTTVPLQHICVLLCPLALPPDNCHSQPLLHIPWSAWANTQRRAPGAAFPQLGTCIIMDRLHMQLETPNPELRESEHHYPSTPPVLACQCTQTCNLQPQTAPLTFQKSTRHFNPGVQSIATIACAMLTKCCGSASSKRPSEAARNFLLHTSGKSTLSFASAHRLFASCLLPNSKS
jgi:hypothetical protein